MSFIFTFVGKSVIAYTGASVIASYIIYRNRARWFDSYVAAGGIATRQEFNQVTMTTAVMSGLVWPLAIYIEIKNGNMVNGFDDLPPVTRQRFIEELNGMHRELERIYTGPQVEQNIEDNMEENVEGNAEENTGD